MTGKQLTLLGGPFGVAAYQIQRSLRFNSADSAYLSRTPASNGNRKTMTWSMWVKRSGLSSYQEIYAASNGSGSGDSILFRNVDSLSFATEGGGGLYLVTSQVFRDVSSWYHLVLSIDTTQATSSNRAKVYVNGVQVTSFSTATYPSQNYDCPYFNTASAQLIGSGYAYLNGYMTEVNFIDGQALTPSSFGETNADTGVWQPKQFTGTYGTTGFYLNFSDNSGITSTTLGKDYSGNSNNWTPNNFSVTAGVGNDSLVDTPTPYGTDTGAGGEVRGNYGTLNPLVTPATMTIVNGNLSLSGYTPYTSAYGTFGMSSGKWYFEYVTYNNAMGGIAGTPNGSQYPGEASDAYAWDSVNATKYNSNSPASYGASTSSGDIVGVAFDADAGTLVFYKNGVSQGNAYTSIPSKAYFPIFRNANTGGDVSVNFGQRPFAYTAPSGFKALCTQNLPTPTIGATSSTMADDYFNVEIWTANGSGAVDRAITSTFQPDMIWSKTRSAGYHNNIFDAVRGFGSNNSLVTDQSWSEGTASGGRIKSVASTSFTWEAGGSSAEWYNQSSNTYVSWYWKANGAGSSNTQGSITSTVSANTTSGFSIVTYTGTGASASVGHGLGAAPQMIIVKGRTNTVAWVVYSIGLTPGYEIYLSTTNAQALSANFGSAPSSTVFNLGSDTNANGNGVNYVAYCFAPVAGYSAFGSYTGNGSADGPFIYTGFRPRYVMLKASSRVESWYIFDTARNTYNVADNRLYANLSSAEGTGGSYGPDILSNGFKLRTSDSGFNFSGATYVYAAFAENPFKYSLAR